jgi:hypothetical protein
MGWITFFSTLLANRSLLPTILVLTLMILPIVMALSQGAIAIFAFSSILFSLITKGALRFDFAAFTELPLPPLESGVGLAMPLSARC